MVLVVVFALFVASLGSKRDDWVLIDDASSDSQVGIYLLLAQKNLSALAELTLQVSTPRTPLYGKHLSKQQVLDLISPPEAVSNEVERLVKQVCPSAVVENRRDSLRVVGSVSCVERLLRVRLGRFVHKENRFLSCVRLHDASPKAVLPAHVEDVYGLSMFPVLRRKKKLFKAESDDFDFIDAAAISRVYKIPNMTISHNSTISLIEFAPEGAPSTSDLQLYDQWNLLPFFNFSRIVGPWNPGNNGESLLDVQLASAIVQTALQYVTITDSWAYGMAAELFALPNPPLVNSVSYSWPEALTCDSVTNAHCSSGGAAAYIARAETELLKLGAIGITVVVCSQDEGAPSEHNSACLLDVIGEPLWPVYPGSSAWVTSVGATTLMPANSKSMVKASAAVPPICTKGRKCATAGTLEEPCMLHNTVYRWTTGGGFSKYIAQQPYQQAQVAAYLKSGVSFPDHHFNATNRAYPDMAAFGSRILVVSGGELGVSAGTSASTPIAAGIIALVNEKRLALKKPALGFFNPALMDMMKNCPQCFNDVTNGNNKCTNLRCCKYGYNNAKGFDAVSGVGSPNVQEWVNYLSNL